MSLFRVFVVVLGVAYLAVAGYALNHTLRVLDTVSEELPVNLLQRHRALSSMAQTLSVLHNKLNAAWSAPSATTENELIAATDAAVVMQSYLRQTSDGRALAEIGPLSAELARVVRRIDELTRQENFDPLEAQLLDTRLDHALNLLESRYLGTSEASIAELSQQIDRIAALRGEVRLLILALVGVSLLAGGLAIGAWAANRRLTAAQKALRRARDDAITANSAKTRFLGNMNAALQTPMNAIIGFSDLLTLTPDTADGADIRRAGEQIGEAGRRLQTQIANLLELAGQEIGPEDVQVTRCFASDVSAQAIGLVAADAAEKDITIHDLSGGLDRPTIAGDPDRLRQILHNFLSNAVKCTAPGAQIWVENETRGDRIRLSVRDNGPGVAREHRDHLFNAFERLVGDVAEPTTAGAGLGLAIARRLAEAMDGTVGYEDAPGGGAVFFVSLPRAKADTPLPGER